ncbi:MAG TPA: alpha/beta hydrolase [Candidatus Dormibacteraeota bacterium]|nr:alpha/beta hydrolase [Candidatus Dormibacteraeota bacterium]
MSKGKTTSATGSNAAGTKATTNRATAKARPASSPGTKPAAAKRAAPGASKPSTPTASSATRSAANPAATATPTRGSAKPAAKARPASKPAPATKARRTTRARATGTTSAPAAPPEALPADDQSAAPKAGDELNFQVSDGLRLHYDVWRPEGETRRLVILVHGFADHSGRFSYLVPHLAGRGAVVYAYDQRGQGRSPGKTGHVANFQRLVDDLDEFVRLATEREAGIPPFLYAHSTGAIAALHYLYENPLAVEGAVLSAPCLMLTFEPPGWKSTLGRTISTVVPGFTMQAGFEPGTVSRDEQVVADNKADPLVSQKMTARFYTEVYLKAMPAALARIDQLQTPYLVLQGTEDRLVSPRVADEFEQRAAAHGIVKRYEGGFHESHNDIHREEVFADVDAWIEGRS